MQADTGSRAETSALPMLGRVLVVGLGKSGKAAARYCLDALRSHDARIDSLTIYGGASTEEAIGFVEPYVQAGCRAVFDEEDIEGTYDIAVMSPGIPARDPFYLSAVHAAGTVMSEPEFAYRESPSRWIGITGTNGKTTTTALCAHLLDEAGFTVRAVGNIGDPCIAAVGNRRPGEYLVAELSSYQLASVSAFSPQAAALLNITPDHLHWHGSHEAYVAAKSKLFDRMDASAWAVIDASTPETAGIARQLAARGVAVATLGDEGGIRGSRVLDVSGTAPRGIAWLDEDADLMRVALGDAAYELVSPHDLMIGGDHNVANALAASALALSLGAPLDAVRSALCTFEPLEHRNEPCGTVDGVSFFNDSKATNTDATLKALGSFRTTPLIMLFGGDDKGTDLEELVEVTRTRCKAVVCFGAARERFLAAFAHAQETDGAHGGSCQVLCADHLADALRVGFAHAVPGDAVCLSPACASFDEFDSFEQRGEAFKEMVATLSRS